MEKAGIKFKEAKIINREEFNNSFASFIEKIIKDITKEYHLAIKEVSTGFSPCKTNITGFDIKVLFKPEYFEDNLKEVLKIRDALKLDYNNAIKNGYYANFEECRELIKMFTGFEAYDYYVDNELLILITEKPEEITFEEKTDAALVEAICDAHYVDIEDFLGYPVSSDVLENLRDRVECVMAQMPEEELSLMKEKFLNVKPKKKPETMIEKSINYIDKYCIKTGDIKITVDSMYEYNLIVPVYNKTLNKENVYNIKLTYFWSGDEIYLGDTPRFLSKSDCDYIYTELYKYILQN